MQGQLFINHPDTEYENDDDDRGADEATCGPLYYSVP